MKQKLSPAEKNILHTLLKSKQGLEAFTIFRRSNLPFSTFMKNILLLEKNGFIDEINEQYYKLTEKGISAASITSSRTKEKPWNIIPDKFNSDKININSYYIPNIKFLDKKFFD